MSQLRPDFVLFAFRSSDGTTAAYEIMYGNGSVASTGRPVHTDPVRLGEGDDPIAMLERVRHSEFADELFEQQYPKLYAQLEASVPQFFIRRLRRQVEELTDAFHRLKRELETT